MFIKLIGSGWKNTSLVDVHGSVTFTLWLCMCNLKCPFCHNWRLASNEGSICKPLDISRLLDDLSASKSFIDYLHVTGGEPLLQYTGLSWLFKEAREMDVATSLNSNLTLYMPLKKLVDQGVIDHVATDLKTPFDELSGLSDASNILFKQFTESLRLIVEKNIPLELRIPVAKNLTIKTLEKTLESIMPTLSKHVENTVIIVNPLLPKPLTNPRSVEWCDKYCMPSEVELEEVADVFRRLGFKTFIKEVPR
ncbi:anaerobic ribonucleoside-triphosphate reductase activating protein [Desulfurococcus amylolyticus]|uniref:Anaerobic ribonucleoside-triphosphate reductase activating protein n=1 Tax=Desulfurococcus amylolyticus DSM 16532 TaxID=768672 RepID=I3XT30_DESAM|nr:anaerobic ribonucleoside-triphosphate reductase activating protein [Desulfurococcus amylolyticus]AFL67104.1 anaerobic ribonucleoside-triphosphate reductase activating protein [Desulfurococcus amylolyticus DSM 16532]